MIMSDGEKGKRHPPPAPASGGQPFSPLPAEDNKPAFCGQNHLDTQDCGSYTSARKNEVLINLWNSTAKLI